MRIKDWGFILLFVWKFEDQEEMLPGEKIMVSIHWYLSWPQILHTSGTFFPCFPPGMKHSFLTLVAILECCYLHSNVFLESTRVKCVKQASTGCGNSGDSKCLVGGYTAMPSKQRLLAAAQWSQTCRLSARKGSEVIGHWEGSEAAMETSCPLNAPAGMVPGKMVANNPKCQIEGGAVLKEIMLFTIYMTLFAFQNSSTYNRLSSF